MTISICCKKLGIDCYFVADGKTGEEAIDSLMQHVRAEHGEEWFEVEEIYEAACRVVRENPG